MAPNKRIFAFVCTHALLAGSAYIQIRCLLRQAPALVLGGFPAHGKAYFFGNIEALIPRSLRFSLPAYYIELRPASSGGAALFDFFEYFEIFDKKR